MTAFEEKQVMNLMKSRDASGKLVKAVLSSAMVTGDHMNQSFRCP